MTIFRFTPFFARARGRCENQSDLISVAKIADKTANLRDITNHPPATWSPERETEYFAWAKQVVDVVRGSHAELEGLFDEAHGQQ